MPRNSCGDMPKRRSKAALKRLGCRPTWSDTITLQLLTREYFATFAPKPVADAHKSCAALIALTSDSREEVDAITKAAAAAGGKADVRQRMDLGWLYNRAFEDPDGHVFEAVWMDLAAASAAAGKQSA